VDELHFSLYQRALHPELFHIYLAKRVEHRLYNAEIWIVGLAHVVTVEFRDGSLTEVVAEPSELLPRAGLANTFRFRGERDYSQTFPGGLQYILSTQVERMTANLFPATHRDLTADGQRRGLFQSFEDWTENEFVPFTLMDYEARDAEFHVHAFHVFPSELTIVKTQSIFETERRRRFNGS
jgi:hypothetical protein